MHRIFLVAANPLLREALGAFLLMQSGDTLAVVGAVSGQSEDLDTIAAAAPDVVVLAVGIEAGEELRALERIRAEAPQAGLVVITTTRCLVCEVALGLEVIDALLVAEGLPDDLVPVVQQLARHRHSVTV